MILMKQHFLRVVLLVLSLSVFSNSNIRAQFGPGGVYVGPELGAGVTGGVPAFGIHAEIPIVGQGKIGTGTVGLALRVNYWKWEAEPVNANPDYHFTYTYIPAVAFINYHFILGNHTLDSYVGIGAGYQVITWVWHGLLDGKIWVPNTSGLIIAGQVGARYFFSPTFALLMNFGFGLANVGIGADFRL
jgi:hypothetical protein